MANLAALRAAVFAICEKPEAVGWIPAPPPGRARVNLVTVMGVRFRMFRSDVKFIENMLLKASMGSVSLS